MLFLLFALLWPLPTAPADTTVRVMTFNIRYDTPQDGVHAWPHRQADVARLMRFHDAGVIGLQEALRHQIDTLATHLPGYAWVGVGRDDGADGGEFSPLFYHTDRFTLVDHGTFWLSETPDVVGSRGWDAALPRVATWARLTHRATGRDFVVVNTHFDHRGWTARAESAQLIAHRLPMLAGDAPAVVMGDFNFEADFAGYAALVAQGLLQDTRDTAQHPPHYAEETCCGFTVEETPGRRIDYIFASPGVAVLRHGVLTDHRRGHYPSDHRPVLVEIVY